MNIEAKFRINRGVFTLHVDLRIPDRGVTGLFGPSGCGKTTLLRAIAGLERHRDGLLTMGGTVWQDSETFVPTHRRSLGYVFQEASLLPHLTVEGNLQYGLKRVPEPERAISLDNAIDLFGIGHLLKRKTDTLSGGERQRVAIARALAVSPGLLLMDEPLASLDLASREEIMPYLESLHDEFEIPVIYVSHTLEETASLADHLILMEDGRITATGETNQMLTRLDLPLAHGTDAGAVIEAVVSGKDEKYHLATLDFGDARFTVPDRDLKEGKRVRLRLPARDVSLTLERQAGSSIRNIVPVTVEEVLSKGNALVTVRLMAEGTPILSRVTQKSADELDLKPGKQLYAQFKSLVLTA